LGNRLVTLVNARRHLRVGMKSIQEAFVSNDFSILLGKLYLFHKVAFHIH